MRVAVAKLLEDLKIEMEKLKNESPTDPEGVDTAHIPG